MQKKKKKHIILAKGLSIEVSLHIGVHLLGSIKLNHTFGLGKGVPYCDCPSFTHIGELHHHALWGLHGKLNC